MRLQYYLNAIPWLFVVVFRNEEYSIKYYHNTSWILLKSYLNVVENVTLFILFWRMERSCRLTVDQSATWSDCFRTWTWTDCVPSSTATSRRRSKHNFYPWPSSTLSRCWWCPSTAISSSRPPSVSPMPFTNLVIIFFLFIKSRLTTTSNVNH